MRRTNHERLKVMLSKEPSNDTEAIFLKYIELRRTADVAAYMNDQGHRIQGARKMRLYINTDITAILDDPEAECLVESDVYDLVKRMQTSGNLTDRKLWKKSNLYRHTASVPAAQTLL